MTEAPHLLVEDDGAILIATLNRPDKLNALSMQLMKSLGETVERFRDTPGYKVMLIRATGRYFSAGADLREGGSGAPPMTGSVRRRQPRDVAIV